MGLFGASINVRIQIEGCPEHGIDALDWRRACGLAERLDNRADVVLEGQISESDYRALVAAGWGYDTRTDGSSWVTRNSLRREYDPTATYGHCAVVAVRSDHSPVELACLALRACAREQRRRDLGVPDIEREIERLTAQIEESSAAVCKLEEERARLRDRLAAIEADQE